MIVVHNLQHFRESVRHAKKAGAWESLKQCLQRLHNPWPKDEWVKRNELHLYKDFAPASFAFTLRRAGAYLISGGLLFYAGAESGVGSPQFSVTTSGRKDARYEIHT